MSDVDVMKPVLAEKQAMRPIKKRRVDLMLTLQDHEGRLGRIEKLLSRLAQEASQEQTGLIVAPTTKQTVQVSATKEG